MSKLKIIGGWNLMECTGSGCRHETSDGHFISYEEEITSLLQQQAELTRQQTIGECIEKIVDVGECNLCVDELNTLLTEKPL